METLKNEILNQSDSVLLNNLFQILKKVDTNQLKYGNKILEELIGLLENLQEPNFDENHVLQLCIALEQLHFDIDNIAFIHRLFEIIISFPDKIAFFNLTEGTIEN